jgi:hypothetical protein
MYFHLTIWRQTLTHLSAKWPRYQGLRHFKKQIIEFVLTFPANLKNVREACCRQKPGRRAFSFNQGIREKRCCMNNATDGGRRYIAFLEEMRKSQHGPARRIVRRSAFFPDDRPAITRVKDNQVSEGAANINTKRERRRHIYDPV